MRAEGSEKLLIWGAVCFALFALSFAVHMQREADKAMIACQMTHSYDTCFQELNR